MPGRQTYLREYQKKYQPKYRRDHKTVASVYPLSVYAELRSIANRMGMTVNRLQRDFLMVHLGDFDRMEALLDLRELTRRLLRQVEPAMGNINQITRKYHENTNHKPGAIRDETVRAISQIASQQKGIVDAVYQIGGISSE